MPGKMWDGAYVPPAQHPMGGTQDIVVELACGHKMKLAANMSSTNAITRQEQERLQDVIKSTPCSECVRKK